MTQHNFKGFFCQKVFSREFCILKKGGLTVKVLLCTIILPERDEIGEEFLDVILRQICLKQTEYRLNIVKG